MKRLARWLKRPVPLNFAMVVFCFLGGATLSFPVSMLVKPLELFEPSNLVSDLCVGTATASAFLLPVWSSMAIERQEKGLALFGFLTSFMMLAVGILLPAIST